MDKIMSNCLEMYKTAFEYYRALMPDASDEQVHMAMIGATMIAIGKLSANEPMQLHFD